MKQWPKDGRPVSFEELAKDVNNMLNFHYQLIRKNVDKEFCYKGYDIGDTAKVTSISPNKALSIDNLDWNLYNNGSEVIDVIIGIVLQLGIEQGIRIANQDRKIEDFINSLND